MGGLMKNKFASLHYICYHIHTNQIIPIKKNIKITLHPDKGGQNVDSVKTKPLLPNDSEAPQTQIANVTLFAFF